LKIFTKFNCLTSFTNKGIKRGLNRGNICCQSVQNILYPLILSRNVKTKIYKRSSNYSCSFCRFDIWSLIPREKHILRVFTYIPCCILILSKFLIHHLMHKWVVLRNNIKIYIKTAPTCFGAVTPSSGSALFVLTKVMVVKIVH
jgi:hypothetical protein